MIVVMTANRASPIVSLRGRIPGLEANSGMVRAGDPLRELFEDFKPDGRHFRAASIEARQGCTCKGYENITRITMAAFPIVEATDGTSTMSSVLRYFRSNEMLTHPNDVANDVVAE
jgi:hypothetical protein